MRKRRQNPSIDSIRYSTSCIERMYRGMLTSGSESIKARKEQTDRRSAISSGMDENDGWGNWR